MGHVAGHSDSEQAGRPFHETVIHLRLPFFTSKGGVSMTIEHARRNSQLPDVLVQEFDERTA
jgi:hypothetical protein